METLDLADEDAVMGSGVSPGKPTTRRYSPSTTRQLLSPVYLRTVGLVGLAIIVEWERRPPCMVPQSG